MFVGMAVGATIIKCSHAHRHGTSGDDTIAEQSGNDHIRVRGGNDSVNASAFGNDKDTVSGGAGNGTINVNDGDALDSVGCGSGEDTIIFDFNTKTGGDDKVDLNSCEFTVLKPLP